VTEKTIAGSPEALRAAKPIATAESAAPIKALLGSDLSKDQIAELAVRCNLIHSSAAASGSTTITKDMLRHMLSADGEREQWVGPENILKLLATEEAASGAAAGLPSTPASVLPPG
jgi:hypothetical protein